MVSDPGLAGSCPEVAKSHQKIWTTINISDVYFTKDKTLRTRRKILHTCCLKVTLIQKRLQLNVSSFCYTISYPAKTNVYLYCLQIPFSFCFAVTTDSLS
jgi:hypothetical protein